MNFPESQMIWVKVEIISLREFHLTVELSVFLVKEILFAIGLTNLNFLWKLSIDEIPFRAETGQFLKLNKFDDEVFAKNQCVQKSFGLKSWTNNKQTKICMKTLLNAVESWVMCSTSRKIFSLWKSTFFKSLKIPICIHIGKDFI